MNGSKHPIATRHQAGMLAAALLVAGCTANDAAGPSRDGGPSGVEGADAGEPPDPTRLDAAVPTDAVDAADAAASSPPPDVGVSAADAAPAADAAAPGCADPLRYFADGDGDGAGDPARAVDVCAPLPGHVAEPGDCDDADPTVGPQAAERCNGRDDDCDGTADNGAADARAFFRDGDGDGEGDPGAVTYACEAPAGHVDGALDCNDGARDVGDCAAGTFCSRAGRCLPEGRCADGADCPAEHVCDDAGACVPGSPCGGQAFAATRVRPDLMLVLDRSCSMRARVGGVRKWQAAVDAITAITRDFGDRLRFGLVLFPDRIGNECRQNETAIPLGEGNGPRVTDLLRAALDDADPNWPDGPCVTNIDSGVTRAALDPALDDPARPHYLMLVTDGRQSACAADGGDAGTERALRALHEQRGVSTYVVGFGGEVSPADLARFAVAGGVPRPGEPRYHQADDAPALLAALRDIAGLLASCEYRLDAVPPNPLELAVFFDDRERVPRDPQHEEGWDYNAANNSVTFFGSACTRLREDGVADVDVVFGCAY